MAWFTRITRFGDAHTVFGQERNYSCGIASVIMCAYKIKKLSTGERSVYESNEIHAKYGSASKTDYTGDTGGTYPTHLVTVLNSLRCGTWKWDVFAPNDASAAIVNAVGISSIGPVLAVKPVIIGIDWEATGAHWIVIDTVRSFAGSTYATVCDPWDADVHIQKFSSGRPFIYDAYPRGISFDLGGKHKGQERPYSQGDRGIVKTWGMIYR